MARNLILVEDESTAANMRACVDPDVTRVGLIDEMVERRGYDMILVRYPSPNWFRVKKWTPEAFATHIRQNVTCCLRQGSTFQYI